jgi:ankyrin repeat protein
MPFRLIAILLSTSTLLGSLGCSRKLSPKELAEYNNQLLEAVDHHKLASVSALLKKGANIEATGYNDMTVLAIAASNGDLPMVQLLLKRGANPHAKDQ